MKKLIIVAGMLLACGESPISDPPETLCAAWSTDSLRNPEEFACVTDADLELIRDTSAFITTLKVFECDDCK